MDISVIVPLFNEEESLPELFAWIKRVMDANDFTYEVIFVNDGSTDRSWNVIEELAEKIEQVKGIKFRRNYGKSPALYCGFKEAQGDVVITMDADLQDSPDEIPGLYQMITKEGYDLVSGYKQNRKQGDPLSKTIPTKLFNATARKVSGIHNLHDFNCGLKAYRREVVKNIEVYGEMHRYIPYLAKNAGFAKIGEKPVHHQARKFGTSKFMGWNRFRKRLSGPDDTLVPEQLRQEANARIRILGQCGVLHCLPLAHRTWASIRAIDSTMAYMDISSPIPHTSSLPSLLWYWAASSSLPDSWATLSAVRIQIVTIIK